MLEVFAGLGKMNWQTFIRTRLPLLNLPQDILEALRFGRIEYAKAKAIASLKVESERKALLEEAIGESVCLSQIRKRVKAEKPPTELGELLARLYDIHKKIKKVKALKDTDKRAKLEELLTQMEALLSGEE